MSKQQNIYVRELFEKDVKNIDTKIVFIDNETIKRTHIRRNIRY